MGLEPRLTKKVQRQPEPDTASPHTAPHEHIEPDPHSLAALQQQVGNRAVQRLVGPRGAGQEAFTLDEHTTERIQQEQGSGQAIEPGVRAEMSAGLGYDLDEVRVHTGSPADSLSRQVSARAFTTGNDIFFRDGEYAPETGTGRELLAHELTHVIDQNEGAVGGSSGGGMTVHAPDDVHERRADAVARQVAATGQVGIQRIYTPGAGVQAPAVQRTAQESAEEIKATVKQPAQAEERASEAGAKPAEIETPKAGKLPEELQTKPLEATDMEESPTLQRKDCPLCA